MKSSVLFSLPPAMLWPPREGDLNRVDIPVLDIRSRTNWTLYVVRRLVYQIIDIYILSIPFISPFMPRLIFSNQYTSASNFRW